MFVRGLSQTEYHQQPELMDIVITYPDGNTHTEEWKKKYEKHSQIHTDIQWAHGSENT